MQVEVRNKDIQTGPLPQPGNHSPCQVRLNLVSRKVWFAVKAIIFSHGNVIRNVVVIH